MPDKSTEFRQRLFEAQEMTPALREGYQRELDAIIHEKHTVRSRAAAITLLVILLACIAGEVRALVVYPGGAMFYIGAVTMLLVCAFASAWIVRDLFRGRSVRKESFKMADLFYAAATILTVAQLIHGLRDSSNPATTFGTLYLFVFMVSCLGWSLYNRIAAVELAGREQALRIECRLADLAEKLGR